MPSIGFQIVPGLAWLKAGGIREAEVEAGIAAYLVDGDREGEVIRISLLDAGIGSDRVFSLTHDDNGYVLEDLISPTVAASAVNSLLALTRSGSPVLDPGDLRDGEITADLAFSLSNPGSLR